jgi:hypothetical protein
MSAHTATAGNSPLLRAILNLSKFHREQRVGDVLAAGQHDVTR